MDMIYLDNAATSFPKPGEMMEAMEKYQREIGANPGRSGHGRSIDAGRVLYDTREALARLFNVEDPLRIALMKNSTEALNIALLGSLRSGDHVITTAMEHNSVMRPLRHLETCGVTVCVIPCAPCGEVDPDDIRKAFRKNTKVVVMTHASNVTGTIMPIEEVGARVREREDVMFCVDAAQTAGSLPIDVQKTGIDLLAFTGHKSLYGPQGTGGLYIRKGLDKKITPLLMGGTGSRSEFEEQPDFMPDKYESGTPNTIGFAGLQAGLAFIARQTIESIRAHEEALTARFLKRLNAFGDDVKIYGPNDASRQTPVVSFNLKDISPSEAAMFFEEERGILCRPGLHCAPSAHRTIHTFSAGTVRFSFGFFNTAVEADAAGEAVQALIQRGYGESA
jgi:cysteine desulfurase family protein